MDLGRAQQLRPAASITGGREHVRRRASGVPARKGVRSAHSVHAGQPHTCCCCSASPPPTSGAAALLRGRRRLVCSSKSSGSVRGLVERSGLVTLGSSTRRSFCSEVGGTRACTPVVLYAVAHFRVRAAALGVPRVRGASSGTGEHSGAPRRDMLRVTGGSVRQPSSRPALTVAVAAADVATAAAATAVLLRRRLRGALALRVG